MAIKIYIHNIFNRITTPIKAFVPQYDEFCTPLGPTPKTNNALHAEYSHQCQNAFQKGAA